ncbi:MAG: hypothetical protein GX970_03225 [Phyllobacteriaceae bacterium]|nr:hypothetical protein [Phyllobacteriaceae bacterium]
MLRRAILIAAVTGALVLPAMAQDEDIERFVGFHAALYLDDKCGFLKQFERGQAAKLETDLQNPLPFEGAYRAGKIDEAQYRAELDGMTSRGRAIADATECTNQQAAAAYILPVRDQSARSIYSELIIAVQSGKLTPEKNQAAHAYEAMIAPLYGQNWRGFVEYAQSQAQRLVDINRDLDASMSPFASGSLLGAFSAGTYSNVGGTDPSAYTTSTYFDSLVSSAVSAVDLIHFEIIAEQSGLRYRTLRSTSGESTILSLIDGQGRRTTDILQHPERYVPIEGGSAIPAVLTIQPDNTLRIMTFGAEAALMQNGSVTFLINPKALPAEQAMDFDYTRSAEWRAAARVFKAERIAERCLGGPLLFLATRRPDNTERRLAGPVFLFLPIDQPGSRNAGSQPSGHRNRLHLHPWRLGELRRRDVSIECDTACLASARPKRSYGHARSLS